MSSNLPQDKQNAAILDALASWPNQDESFVNFATHICAALSVEDADHYLPEQNLKMWERSLDHLALRGQSAFSLNFWTPEGDIVDPPQVIDIFTPDMPFVVDSVLGAIRASGGTIRSFAHPILPLREEEDGIKVAAQPGATTKNESYLLVHIDPLKTDEQVEAMRAEIEQTLNEVRRAVRGWRPMLERLKNLVTSYRQSPPDVPSATLAESVHFLSWLAEHNFTFLGMREYRLIGRGPDARLEPVNPAGLGILQDPNFLFLRNGEDLVEMTEQHVSFLQTSAPLMVTKANVRSRVHRRVHMDYIGVKLYGPDGALTGELRILGLFTSMSLTTPHNEVPLIRRKIADVMRRSGLNPQSHAGKALSSALDNYPREELFQIGENELFDFSQLISKLTDRPQVRVLPRIDRFNNYVSILVFIPRDHYRSDLRAEIGKFLAEQYDGRVSTYYPHFPEGELVRVHFIIGRNGGSTPRPRRVMLEQKVTDLSRSFGDRILAKAQGGTNVSAFQNAFSTGYQSNHSVDQALNDIEISQSLQNQSDIAVRLSRPDKSDLFLLKVYHLAEPVPLSDRVPLLENFGFRVIDERSYTFNVTDAPNVYLNEMQLELDSDKPVNVASVAQRLQDAIQAIWLNQAESDAFNRLCVVANLNWEQVAVIRAYAHYMKQMGLSYSQSYIAQVLRSNLSIAQSLFELFELHHDPKIEESQTQRIKSINTEMDAALEQIESLDEDRILRQLRNLISNTLRTNYYQRGEDGSRPQALALKFDPHGIENLPAPVPYREIFVYAPRVEGVHLRGGPIARGGLRWSDRREDFRTEILGLVKAQMTKNAVIVPLGAKGGFVPKQMPLHPDRDTFIAEGTACYKIFISSLLSITDNLQGDEIIPPQNVKRLDGDDPYLVVAADKGTATFSDTANAISQDHDFWLDDAFASGGSAGYDHKKMGITARGGWEAVKRHFREMDHDIQSEPFTAIGVGDMSGDVFGNGMLLSEQTKLIAAFDHRDIFIDPNPDPASSFAERKRLFDLGRSSWNDYDEKLISAGGGIFSRGLKSIPISAEIREALNIDASSLTPNQLMIAILKHQADLLWFGGIGTYVRASSETNVDAGDRANDAIRVTAKEVGAKVIGEGANLGITQLARIEFAQNGGRINTDSIDNSAGVNSSDLEVNIKIAMGTVMRSSDLTIEQRNDFLERMTDEVADLCLRNNYLQTLAISLTQRQGTNATPDLLGLIHNMENRNLLIRDVEFLPTDVQIAERTDINVGFSRPEIAVLLAYAKNSLFDDLLKSEVPDDPYLGKELLRYFPNQLNNKHPESIQNHRLKREVIATVLANAMINRGGPGLVTKLSAATSADSAHIAYAYAAARDTFDLVELNREVDQLDNKISGATQLELYGEIQTLLTNQSLWFLRHVPFQKGLEPVIDAYAGCTQRIRSELDQLLPPFIRESVAKQAKRFEDGGTPAPLARRIAELSALTLASDITFVSQAHNADVLDAAKAYFAVLEQFNLGRITELSLFINLSDTYDRMALDRALANLMRAQRDLTEDVLAAGDGDIAERHKAWNENLKSEITRIHSMVTDLTQGELTVSRLSVAAGLLSDLARH